MQQFVLPLESGQARIRSSVREAGKRRERENTGNWPTIICLPKIAQCRTAFSLFNFSNSAQEWLLAYRIGLQRQHTTQRDKLNMAVAHAGLHGITFAMVS